MGKRNHEEDGTSKRDQHTRRRGSKKGSAHSRRSNTAAQDDPDEPHRTAGLTVCSQSAASLNGYGPGVIFSFVAGILWCVAYCNLIWSSWWFLPFSDESYALDEPIPEAESGSLEGVFDNDFILAPVPGDDRFSLQVAILHGFSYDTFAQLLFLLFVGFVGPILSMDALPESIVRNLGLLRCELTRGVIHLLLSAWLIPITAKFTEGTLCSDNRSRFLVTECTSMIMAFAGAAMSLFTILSSLCCWKYSTKALDDGEYSRKRLGKKKRGSKRRRGESDRKGGDREGGEQAAREGVEQA